MEEWFKRASATFAGGAVAIGILAIPTFVWLPRELDGLSDRIDENKSAIKVVEQKVDVLDGKMDGLGLAMMELQNEILANLDFQAQQQQNTALVAAFADRNKVVVKETLTENLPGQLAERWTDSDKINALYAAMNEKRTFLFVDQSQLNLFSMPDLEALERVGGQDDVVMEFIDLEKDFPGFVPAIADIFDPLR